MSQRAFLYTVRVKVKRAKEYRLLGDLEGAGTQLIDLLSDYTTNLELESEDETKTVTSAPVPWSAGEEDDDEELYISLRHGERDVAAEIFDSDGAEQYRQKRTDEARVRCGALFVLPADQDLGWFAIHSNSGRGVKGLLGPALIKRFAQSYDDLMLEISPYVDLAALRQAVDDGHIGDVRLTKVVKPGDEADAATNRWVPAGDVGKIELRFTPRGRGKFLRANPIQRFLHGNQAERQQAATEIVQFEGVEFDEARIEVKLPNGKERTFYVQRDSPIGHPWVVDIDDQIEFDQDDNPTDASIRDALQDVLDPVLQ